MLRLAPATQGTLWDIVLFGDGRFRVSAFNDQVDEEQLLLARVVFAAAHSKRIAGGALLNGLGEVVGGLDEGVHRAEMIQVVRHEVLSHVRRG